MFAVSAKAQTDSKDVSITASGSGKTLENAKQAALRSVTEKAFGVRAAIESRLLHFYRRENYSIISISNIKTALGGILPTDLSP